MQHRKLLYLIYRRLRVGLGILGFILMYGAYTGNFSPALLLIGFGFTCIELFGAFYNDHQDYELDIRNRRKDKWTTSGLINRMQMRTLSFLTLSAGLLALLTTNLLIFMTGVGYGLALFAYSKPRLPLGRDIQTYLLLASLYLFLVPSMNMLFQRSLVSMDLYFMMFCFFQSIYLFSQKDSTDTKDSINIFLKNWNTAALTCTISAGLSLLFLSTFSIYPALLIAFWFVNLSAKYYLLNKIIDRKVNRINRGRILLIEFLTPYFYIAGGV